jgi:integrase
MKLTDKAIRAAAPGEKPYRLSDGGGLNLFVSPAGGRLWRYRYEMQGKERQLALGAYPTVGLAEARRGRDAARALLDKGQDPSVQKRVERAQVASDAAATFETVARAWFEIRKATWSASHARDVERNLEADVLPRLGSLPIKSIKPRMVLDMLREVEERSLTTARKVRQQVSAVFVYAIAEDLAEIDPAQMIGGAMRPSGETQHHPALTDPAAIRDMLAKVDGQPAFPSSRLALRLLALTAVRSKELRGAMPDELEGLGGPEPLWRIPKERMKGRKGKKREHIVPLSAPAAELFQLAMTYAGKGRRLFPSSRSSQHQLSENALNRMLHRAGYEGTHTPHGFRASFSTIMNDRHPGDRAIIDLMLAHKPENAVEAAYNRAAHMKRKRELAEEWANLITDGLHPAAELLQLARSGMGRPPAS